jgi:phosphoglycerol transferase MdoB-like AlkP superfamily enzyme
MKTKLFSPFKIFLIKMVGFYMLTMFLLRVGLLLFFNINVGSLKLLDVFVLGFRFDIRQVLIPVFITFIVSLFVNPFNHKWVKNGMVFIWTIFSVLFIFFYTSDFMHYAYLSQRLNASVLNYLEDAKISLNMAWQSYPVIKLLFIIILLSVGFYLIIRLFFKQSANLQKPIKRINIPIGVLFFILCAIGIFGRVGQYPLRWSDAFSLGNDNASQLALNPFQSFFSTLNFRHSNFDLQKTKEHYNLIANYLNVESKDSVTLNYIRKNIATDTTNKPNVVLVICESFSAYKSTVGGNTLNTTPYFSMLAEQGVYFNQCFSPAYGTARGVWAIMTGIPDVQFLKTSSRNPLAVSQHIIMNEFNGYEKYYFLGGSTSWANIRGLLTNNINNLHLYEEGSYKSAKIDVWGISDKNLFLEANQVIKKEKKPFFAIIQTADNHRPYTIPEEDLGEFKKENISVDTLSKYGFTSLDEYNAFRYTDFCFQKFIESAKKESYFENTIFVFVGDHGIRGDASQFLPKVYTQQGLTSEHVPLLFYAPNLLKAQKFQNAVSQVDILPTIASLCNIQYTNTTLGREIMNPRNKNSEAFIIDIDSKRIGVVSDNLFYSYSLVAGQEQISSMLHNEKIVLTDSLKNKYKKSADAFYETSRYMLLNNKKRN